jgi:hypothetical protein
MRRHTSKHTVMKFVGVVIDVTNELCVCVGDYNRFPVSPITSTPPASTHALQRHTKAVSMETETELCLVVAPLDAKRGRSCMRVYVCECTCVCVCVCVYVYAYVCMCVCLWVCMVYDVCVCACVCVRERESSLLPLLLVNSYFAVRKSHVRMVRSCTDANKPVW